MEKQKTFSRELNRSKIKTRTDFFLQFIVYVIQRKVGKASQKPKLRPEETNQKDDDQFLLLPQVLYSFTNGGTELREK